MISILVLTYNSKWNKFEDTLKSILCQKNIEFEIVIADDGSRDNNYENLVSFFVEHNYHNYVFVDNKENRGTVKNCILGLEHCKGDYIKTISPGDMFVNEYSLTKWYKKFIDSNKLWSFCEAYYFKRDDRNQMTIVDASSHPGIVDSYINNLDKKSRWNYVVLDDTVLGAATICKRDILLKYLKRIEDKVLYVEDTVYRLMMFDNICPYYYPEKAIYYEYGTGISTIKSDIWKNRLIKDLIEANKILTNDNSKIDDFQKKIINRIKIKYSDNVLLRNFQQLLFPDKLLLEIKRRLFK